MSDTGITLTNVELSTLPFGFGNTGAFDPSSFVAVDYSNPSSPQFTGANVSFVLLSGGGTVNFNLQIKPNRTESEADPHQNVQ